MSGHSLPMLHAPQDFRQNMFLILSCVQKPKSFHNIHLYSPFWSVHGTSSWISSILSFSCTSSFAGSTSWSSILPPQLPHDFLHTVVLMMVLEQYPNFLQYRQRLTSTLSTHAEPRLSPVKLSSPKKKLSFVNKGNGNLLTL